MILLVLRMNVLYILGFCLRSFFVHAFSILLPFVTYLLHRMCSDFLVIPVTLALLEYIFILRPWAIYSANVIIVVDSLCIRLSFPLSLFMDKYARKNASYSAM